MGGRLENRARILIDVVKSLKKACGDRFATAVKLNSADFQRGGFDIDDAEQVVKMLGRSADDRTLAREAYFLEFSSKIAKHVSLPIMTTGGICRYGL